MPRPWPTKVVMLVTDRTACGDRSLAEVVAGAIEGGANVVHLRERDLPAGELLGLARQLRGVCGTRALLLINDRVDVALLCGADGVHLPDQGLPTAAVRQMLPPTMKVGRSVHSVAAARQAELDGADYVVAGTIFKTPSHVDALPGGVEQLQNITRRLNIPVVAIGGINAANAPECWNAGADGVAAISAIMRAPDPQAAAEELAFIPQEAQEEPCASS